MRTDPTISLKAPAAAKLPTERGDRNDGFANMLNSADHAAARSARDDKSDKQNVSYSERPNAVNTPKRTEALHDERPTDTPETNTADRLPQTSDEKVSVPVDEQLIDAIGTPGFTVPQELQTPTYQVAIDGKQWATEDTQISMPPATSTSGEELDVTPIASGTSGDGSSDAGLVMTASEPSTKTPTSAAPMEIATQQSAPPPPTATAPASASDASKTIVTGTPIAAIAMQRPVDPSLLSEIDSGDIDTDATEAKTSIAGTGQRRSETTFNLIDKAAPIVVTGETETEFASTAFSRSGSASVTTPDSPVAIITPHGNDLSATRSENIASPPGTPSAVNTQISTANSFVSELKFATDISATTETVSTRLPPAPATHQVAIQISRAVQDGNDRFTLELKPADLGRVAVKMEVGHDGRVIAVIQAERSDTLELLQRDARALERALQEAGLRTDSGSLSFSLQGEGADGQTSDEDGVSAKDSNFLVQEDLVEDQNSAPAHASVLNDSGIDIHV
ncbi:MAG: hypothetical protein GKS01_06315 [Alphaproteobacteria bacterium]|nr:hypothetical protein [Alphaproteobacteria bacterium]